MIETCWRCGDRNEPDEARCVIGDAPITPEELDGDGLLHAGQEVEGDG